MEDVSDTVPDIHTHREHVDVFSVIRDLVLSSRTVFKSTAMQKLLSFIRSHLFIFAFISNILGGGS